MKDIFVIYLCTCACGICVAEHEGNYSCGISRVHRPLLAVVIITRGFCKYSRCYI